MNQNFQKVSENWMNIFYIKNPSEKIQLAAVNNHAYALLNIKKPSLII
jgi:hypothetical protein